MEFPERCGPSANTSRLPKDPFVEVLAKWECPKCVLLANAEPANFYYTTKGFESDQARSIPQSRDELNKKQIGYLWHN